MGDYGVTSPVDLLDPTVNARVALALYQSAAAAVVDLMLNPFDLVPRDVMIAVVVGCALFVAAVVFLAG